jgi:hypothetical protein
LATARRLTMKPVRGETVRCLQNRGKIPRFARRSPWALGGLRVVYHDNTDAAGPHR